MPFPKLGEIPTQLVRLQHTGQFFPFLQVSAFSLKSSRTLWHLGINLSSTLHQLYLYNKAMESRNPNSLVTEWHTQQLPYLVNMAEHSKASRLSWNYAHESLLLTYFYGILQWPTCSYRLLGYLFCFSLCVLCDRKILEAWEKSEPIICRNMRRKRLLKLFNI